MSGCSAVFTFSTSRLRASGWFAIPKRSATESTVAFVMPVNASTTPTPEVATVSKTGTRREFRDWSSSVRESTSGRSRLLYARTSGTCSGFSPLALRFSARFARLSSFALANDPASTARRVALYWTWPGTV
jgi:hypothetical protein